MKKKLVILVMSFLAVGLSACGKKAGTTASSNTIETESSRIDSEKTNEVNSVIDALNEGFSETNDIRFTENDKTFHLIPISGTEMSATLNKIEMNPTSDKHQKAIVDLAVSIKTFEDVMIEKLGDGYALQLDGTTEGSKALFTIRDGVVTYPYLD